MTAEPQNLDYAGRGPAAPAWDGDLKDLTVDELWARDRGLMLHISAVLVRYDSIDDDFTPSGDMAEARPWLQRLADVRNEQKRRERASAKDGLRGPVQ